MRNWNWLQRDFVRRRIWSLRIANLEGRVDSLKLISWYRDWEWNRAVGGSPVSQHMLGLAVDIHGPYEQRERLAGVAHVARLTPIQEDRHLHIQFFRTSQNPLRPQNQRQEARRCTRWIREYRKPRRRGR